MEYTRVAEEISQKFPRIEITDILGLFIVKIKPRCLLKFNPYFHPRRVARHKLIQPCWFILNSEIVDPGKLEIGEYEDMADNKFFECATAGGCGVIASGDKHVLKMSEYRGVKILKPRYF